MVNVMRDTWSYQNEGNKPELLSDGVTHGGAQERKKIEKK